MAKDYRFLDKDPIIDIVKQAYLDSNMMAHDVADRARIARTTFDKWLYGETKKPQNYTVFKVLTVLGVDIHYHYVSGEKAGQEVVVQPGIGNKFRKRRKKTKPAESVQEPVQEADLPTLRLVHSKD